ncbi:MAG TPA: hypothetical protein VHL98_11100 [Microvirga sp.]|jgi:uncharacterized membrane protein YdcZ (DUF606 family)|nr:hypothetical protein [Microvirga sp.]
MRKLAKSVGAVVIALMATAVGLFVLLVVYLALWQQKPAMPLRGPTPTWGGDWPGWNERTSRL